MSTSTPRVKATRARQQAQGLKRLELLAHPDDAAQLKQLADTLARARRGQIEAQACRQYPSRRKPSNGAI